MGKTKKKYKPTFDDITRRRLNAGYHMNKDNEGMLIDMMEDDDEDDRNE